MWRRGRTEYKSMEEASKTIEEGVWERQGGRRHHDQQIRSGGTVCIGKRRACTVALRTKAFSSC
jgi:hypothetical protein